MIRFDNSLQLQRLVILKSGGKLYDEKFHAGVNIIRGENTSGKSTIADFIFFSLGGDVSEWTPEAMSADAVSAQVLLNGKGYTLTRDVEPSARPPIYFYEGAFDEAIANRSAWSKYPAARSANAESFSQVIFRLLRLPEQKTEAQQNITMHQMLRLLYMDQMSPVDQIFRKEKFDTKDIRIAVSELLLGIDNLEAHDVRLRIRDLDRKYGELVGELRSIFGVLGKTSDSDITVTNFQNELAALQRERDSVAAGIEELSQRRDADTRKKATKQSQEAATQLREINAELVRVRQEAQTLALDIEDSQQFIRTLHERIDAIDASKGMAEILGAATFNVCPACLAPVALSSSPETCPLCKAGLPEPSKWAGHLKMREELAFQARESTHLLNEKQAAAVELQDRIRWVDLEQKRVSSVVSEFTRRVDPIDAEVANSLKRIGYIEKTLEDIARKSELATLVKGKMAEREAVREELDRWRTHLEAFEAARENRRSEVRYEIVEFCLRALHRDLPMEEVFQSAELVDFDFGANRLAVNGRAKFSASSATYLKNAFLFSLLELSLYDAKLRWPRFILLDNVEDKGMQPKRSANFQEYVVERSTEAKVEHQIIMTTSMISPKLENSTMCIGPHYTETYKTLRFAQG